MLKLSLISVGFLLFFSCQNPNMKVISEIPADSYPVGMDISSDDKELIVTSQGKEGGGGNSVMVFKISIQK